MIPRRARVFLGKSNSSGLSVSSVIGRGPGSGSLDRPE